MNGAVAIPTPSQPLPTAPLTVNVIVVAVVVQVSAYMPSPVENVPDARTAAASRPTRIPTTSTADGARPLALEPAMFERERTAVERAVQGLIRGGGDPPAERRVGRRWGVRPSACASRAGRPEPKQAPAECTPLSAVSTGTVAEGSDLIAWLLRSLARRQRRERGEISVDFGAKSSGKKRIGAERVCACERRGRRRALQRRDRRWAALGGADYAIKPPTHQQPWQNHLVRGKLIEGAGYASGVYPAPSICGSRGGMGWN